MQKKQVRVNVTDPRELEGVEVGDWEPSVFWYASFTVIGLYKPCIYYFGDI